MEETPDGGDESDGNRLSWRNLLPITVIVVILLGVVLVYFNLPPEEDVVGSGNLSVYYLMPVDCVECNPLMMDEISSDLGIEIRVIRTKIVPRPSILIIYGDRADMGVANSRLNVLSLLCEFANISGACELRDEAKDIESAVDCLAGYNVSSDSIIFYTGDDCEHCSEMKPWIRQLTGEGYVFYTIDIMDENRTKIADECLPNILDLRGNIPQFACAALGRTHMGAFTSFEEMRDFTVNCRLSQPST
jgi:hypothetical protein